MDVADFAYELPDGSIAQTPIEPRDRARLLVDRGPGEPPEHRTVADLPAFIRPGDVVVVNSTRVLPARLRLHKPTGGAVEVLLLERLPGGQWEALVRPSRKVAPGTELTAGADLSVRFAGPGPGPSGRGSGGHVEGTRLVELRTGGGVDELGALDRHGVVPLPPYITSPLADPERYQTVFADRSGSVAAPTAGLHLTPAVLDGCRAAGARIEMLDLVVGLGTFRPISTRKVEDHHMHAERYQVSAETLAACEATRAAGGRVVAVGTTTVRALESAALSGQLEGRTELFIHRPWRWCVVDVLLTNFHLPRSSLLVLVDAFVGPRWRALYGDALAGGYRFLSFGDAMLLDRRL
ncbi:MAG TPA: tRNA preQ1(34) S-adenosylmethionine ribosyltransferase-isomerase QueA [Acidimicrobiales bacterium]|nr:tRNA preQ1(34) S-adenosylmethionine ribosyltransferase-isomerase QueA [Acidimicrobiales bacterium]